MRPTFDARKFYANIISFDEDEVVFNAEGGLDVVEKQPDTCLNRSLEGEVDAKEVPTEDSSFQVTCY